MPTFFHDMTLELDEKEIAKGDTLDLKAGILLALGAILVTINGTLLAYPHLSKHLEVAQFLSLLTAALAAFFAFTSIIHFSYDRPASSSAYKTWIAKFEAKGLPQEAEAAVSAVMVRDALKRTERNNKINRGRTIWLLLAFLAATLSLVIDIITLSGIAIVRIHS